jgi:glycosyltransferase involved in cell wall biosynthesis
MRRIGLIGYCCDTGLGLVTRDFHRHLPFDSWLVIKHPMLGVAYDRLDESCEVYQEERSGIQVINWLERLDAVFSVQSAYIPWLWRLCKKMGKSIGLMPNAEWLQLDLPSTNLVDRFIAPTQDCAALLAAAGFADRTVYIPHVIDTSRFAFKCRRKAELFLHCRGWGGYSERKGTAVFIEAARRCPEIPFALRFQREVDTDIPPNVQVFGVANTPEELYNVGDVAIQPSKWEGVGLQIIEAMACGLPTIVCDAAPMNEHVVERSLCVTADPTIVRIGRKNWTAWHMNIDHLVSIVRSLYRQPIEHMSARARQAMQDRSWDRLRASYIDAIFSL